MIFVDFHKNFKKRYKKLRKREQIKCAERIALFTKEPFHPILDNHVLTGKYKGYRSINITGDMRALYEPVSRNVAFFIIIGTHHKLFGS